MHGGYGFTEEFPVSRFYRGARYGTLGGGTTETAVISLGGTVALQAIRVGSFDMDTAIQTFVLQRNSDVVREVYTWILGRLGTTGWDDVRLALPSVVVMPTARWSR